MLAGHTGLDVDVGILGEPLLRRVEGHDQHRPLKRLPLKPVPVVRLQLIRHRPGEAGVEDVLLNGQDDEADARVPEDVLVLELDGDVLVRLPDLQLEGLHELAIGLYARALHGVLPASYLAEEVHLLPRQLLHLDVARLVYCHYDVHSAVLSERAGHDVGHGDMIDRLVGKSAQDVVPEAGGETPQQQEDSEADGTPHVGPGA
mmetsp:Transcript_41648/g.107783  ORF Transcript_41648/g.107783 Transcript_41648/m.107783 type:complete len:203 (-) Transcript_41648:263-871(-)